MMLLKEMLKSIVNELSSYSQTLNKTSIFVEQPWAMIDEEFELQKLIFRRNKELILSKNGNVQIGSWDYLPEARSLIINRKTDIILCNEAFIDQGVMILKLDGTVNKYFALANENIIPDLDIIKYLENLRIQFLNLSIFNLIDGKKLEIVMNYGFPARGDIVRLFDRSDTNRMFPDDGIFTLEDGRQSISVKSGKFSNFLFVNKYINPSGEEIILHTHSQNSIVNYDHVIYKGELFTDGQIDLSEYKILIAKNSKIKIKDKRSFLKRLIIGHSRKGGPEKDSD